ncbi:MAG: (2Fe-2S)-binding protein [Pseudomonadota bacterium]
MSKTPVTFRLNGEDAAAFADAGSNLLDFLRRSVGDLSPKYGCGQGTCGACTVLIDGEPHLACITLAETVSGREVRTTGGLANGPTLDRLQEAFIDKFAAQCGYCTPGMLMAATALLDKNPNPSRQDVIDAIGGNICRCTGYEPIVDAILEASRNTRGAA